MSEHRAYPGAEGPDDCCWRISCPVVYITDGVPATTPVLAPTRAPVPGAFACMSRWSGD